METVKCKKGLRNALISNNEKHVDLYVMQRGKNSWVESEKVDSVKEHVQDDAEKCDADDEQGGDSDVENFIQKKSVSVEYEGKRRRRK